MFSFIQLVKRMKMQGTLEMKRLDQDLGPGRLPKGFFQRSPLLLGKESGKTGR